MEAVRDLAEADPWQESLERSKARRAESKRSSSTRPEPPAARARARDPRSTRLPASSRRLRRQAIARRRRMVARSATGFVALALTGGIVTWSLVGHASPVSPSAAHADVTPAAHHGEGHAGQIAHVSARAALSRPPTCLQVDKSTGYTNPLAGARVKGERIDMGVDYAGSGKLGAIGDARMTHVATDGTGWPGAFIEYQLLNGPDAGCYVYYAEGVTPRPGLRVGDRVRPGQTVATIIPDYPTGFELGWGAGAGTKTFATVRHQWSSADDQHDRASRAGKNFSALLASLGAPAGKVEG